MFLLFVLFVMGGIILIIAGLGYLANFISVMANLNIHVRGTQFVYMVCVAGILITIGLIIVLRYLPAAINA